MITLELLFRLFCGHAIADYCLQNDFIANNKNRHAEPKGYDPKLHGPRQMVWPYVLLGHGATHGFMVYITTGRASLGIAEMLIHSMIDFGKCEKWYGIHTDQWLHFGCKFVYAYLIMNRLV